MTMAQGSSTRTPSMRMRMTIMLIVVLLVIGAIVGYNVMVSRQVARMMAAGTIPPATVSTLTASTQEWQDSLTEVGSLRAVRGVDLSTEIAGLVRRVSFASGRDVAPGAVLVELNADAERAQVESLRVAVELARTTLKRDREQLSVQAVSQATIDNDDADLRSKQAQLAQMQATLEKKTILAPFAGRLGISTIAPGQYLNAGDKIVSLQAIDPIYIDFYVPQQEINRIRLRDVVVVTTDAWPGREFKGRLSALNSTIDPSTRNIQVEATIANPERRLLPGMYAKAAIQVGVLQRYITLPQAAVTYNPYGATVFLAEPRPANAPAGQAPATPGAHAPSLVAEQTFVTLGPTRGDQVAVIKGIKEGDVVVSGGQLKLRSGTPLIVNNSVQPLDNPSPRPQEH